MGTTMDKTQRNLMMVLPLLFITVVSRFPTGLIIYWMTTNLWTVGQGLVTRRLVPKKAAAGAALPSGPKRSSRTPARETENGAAAAEAKPKAGAAREAARRQAEEGRLPPVSDDADASEVTVEATGETVGEAKWKALRDLERAAPGLDKATVRFQVVSEGERGLLGVGYTPARVLASTDAVPPPPRAAGRTSPMRRATCASWSRR